MSLKTTAPAKSQPAGVDEAPDIQNQEVAEVLTMLEGLSDACLAAGRDGKLCYANDAARELFHLKGRVTGRRLPLVLADRKALDLFEEAVREGRPRVRSLPLTLSGEGSRTYSVSVVPVMMAGREMLLRIALRRLDLRAEPVNSAGTDPLHGAFGPDTIQRLGDPLTIIQGYLENLLDGVIQDPVVMRQCLSAMRRQAAQIQRILGSVGK